jgi:hypothetical protein
VSCYLWKWSYRLAVVAADGRFRVDNMRSGDYRICITDLPEGFYLKDAFLSERDVINAPLRSERCLLLTTPLLDALRREIRRMSPDVRIDTEDIRHVLAADVLKREVQASKDWLEGDQSAGL